MAVLRQPGLPGKVLLLVLFFACSAHAVGSGPARRQGKLPRKPTAIGPLAIPWSYVGDGYAHITRPPYFLWNPELQPWTLSSTEPATGRGGLPQGAAAYLAAVPKGDPTAILPWKVYEDGRPYSEGSTACALYHCVADNIIAADDLMG